MQENLVIVESPPRPRPSRNSSAELHRQIELRPYPGPRQKDLIINITEGFKPVYEIPSDEKVVDELTKLAKSKTVWLASR